MSKEDLSITYENNIFYCTKNNTKWISVDGEKWYGDEKRIANLEKENAELKKEWQEQVQKATDEGYARTLQTIQLVLTSLVKFLIIHITKAREIILRLYNAGRDVLMCRAEEKAYDNLSNAINDKSIEQSLSEMDDEDVMELAEEYWLEFKSRIETPESVSEKDADEFFKVLRMIWKIAFFTGYNFCEEKENPTLSFAKTTLRNLFNGGKIKF